MIHRMNVEPLHVPPLETATEPIHSATDMCQRWRAVMGRLGFGSRVLWVGFVGPDRAMIKMLIDLQRPARADPHLVDALMEELAAVLDDEMQPGTTVALLLTGPGSCALSESNRQWATALSAAATKFGVPLEPIFGADDHDLVLVGPPPQAG